MTQRKLRSIAVVAKKLETIFRKSVTSNPENHTALVNLPPMFSSVVVYVIDGKEYGFSFSTTSTFSTISGENFPPTTFSTFL